MYPSPSMFDNGHDCMLNARPPCCTYEALWPAPRHSGNALWVRFSMMSR